MALALKDRVKETTIVVGTGTATLLGSSIGFQPFSVVGNGNTTYYCISDQFGSNWEVGIGTYSTSGNTLARTTVLASSNGGALVVFTAGIKDVFVTYPAEKGVWLDASGNAIGLGTPAAFVGTNITGTASGLTAGNVTTNANLTGAVTSSGNATSLGSFTSAQLALAISDETGTGKAVFATNPTLTSPTYAGTLTGSTDILNIGSGQIYKDASGNVGIGTSSPSTKLTVSATAAAQSIVSTVTANASYLVLQNSADNSNAYVYAIGKELRLSQADTSASSIVTVATQNTERMRIDSSGNLLVGTTSGSYKITCNGQPGANGYTAWTNYSDQRLKKNITEFKGGLKEVLNLKPKSFNYNELSGYDEDTRNRTVSGFVAQELELVCPEMVGTTEINGVEYLDTNTSNLNLLLVKAIQELKAIIDTQQEQINSLLGK